MAVNWEVGMDVTQVIQATGALSNAFVQQNKTIEDAIVTMSKYNAQYNLWFKTVQGHATDGTKFTAQFAQNQAGITGPARNINFSQDQSQSLLDRLPTIATVTLLRRAIITMVHEISVGTQEAIKFETEISRIRSVAVGATGSFTEWATAIQGVSDAFGQSQTDVAQAALKALGSQLVQSKADVLALVQTGTQFAEITGGTAVQGVEALTSAIKAFGLEANDAQQVAEKLYVITSNTGASTQEVGSAFEKAGVQANSLGVSFDEFGGALLTLTKQGVSFKDASTVLVEILTRLGKPSKELEQTFEKWGVATGDAAIATYGFQGVISKLADAAKGSVPELQALYNSLHGAKGATGISLFKDFQDGVSKIQNGAEDYKKAAQTIIESPGKQIQIELNKIKNYFVDDLGADTLAIINNASKQFGGLANAVKIYGDILVTVGVAYGTYIAYTTASTVATGLWTAATTAAAAGGSSLQIALAGLNGPALLFTATFLGAYNVLKKVQSQTDAINDSLQHFAQRNAKAAQVKFFDDSEVKGYERDVSAVFTAVDKTLADAFVNANTRLNTLRETTSDLAKDLEVGFTGVLSTIQEGIKGIGKRITEAQDEIKKSTKSTIDFQKSLEDGLRQEQNKFATPQQKIGFNNQYIKQLQDQIRKEYASGDKDQIEDARKKFEEIAKLERENFDTQVEIAKQGGGQIAVNISKLKYQYEDLAHSRAQYESAYRAQLRDSLTSLEALDAKEKERVKAIQNAVKQFTDLEKKANEGTFDKNKPEDKQYFGSDGKVDQQKVKDALTQKAALIINGAGQVGAELLKISRNINDQTYQSAVQLEGQVKDLKIATARQIANEQAVLIAQGVVNGIKAAQEESIARKKITLEAAADFKKTQKDLNDALTGEGPVTEIKNALNGLQGLIDKTNTGNDTTSIIAKALGLGSPEEKAAAAQAQTQLDTYKKRLQELKATAGEALKTPEGLDNFLGKLRVLQQQAEALKAALVTLAKTNDPNIENEFQAKTPSGAPLGATTQEIQKQQDALAKIAAAAVAARASLSGAEGDITDVITNATGSLSKALNDALGAGNGADAALKQNFDNISTYIGKTTAQIQAFNAAINGLSLKGVLLQVTSPDPNVPAAPNQGGVDNPQGFAGGGYLWGPRGGDNIPAWLSKGEFVVNAAATDMYRPILESMNQSKRPGYYASGGYVTTNVGDININYTSSGKAETDVRKIGNMLRREIKRGNVTLR